jgi:hypothetical protein
MIREEADFIGGMNMCDEISNEAYKKIMCHCEEQEPCEDAISRQAVLDAMYELCNTEETLEENPWRDNPHIDAITDAIENLPSVTPTHKEWIPVPEGATNKDMFKTVFGYKPAADAVVCNKEEWCGASEPCNYCIANPNAIGREEDWWNSEYKAESEG